MKKVIGVFKTILINTRSDLLCKKLGLNFSSKELNLEYALSLQNDSGESSEGRPETLSCKGWYFLFPQALLREAGAVVFSPTSLEPALLTDHSTASSKFLQMAWKMSL